MRRPGDAKASQAPHCIGPRACGIPGMGMPAIAPMGIWAASPAIPCMPPAGIRPMPPGMPAGMRGMGMPDIAPAGICAASPAIGGGCGGGMPPPGMRPIPTGAPWKGRVGIGGMDAAPAGMVALNAFSLGEALPTPRAERGGVAGGGVAGAAAKKSKSAI